MASSQIEAETILGGINCWISSGWVDVRPEGFDAKYNRWEPYQRSSCQ